MKTQTLQFTEVKHTCSKCGGPMEDHRQEQSYCLSCMAAYMRINRPKYKRKYSELSREAKKKASARIMTNKYIRKGLLIPEPCRDCGSEQVEAHHEDYTKPLEVTWFCRTHHRLWHRVMDGKRI